MYLLSKNKASSETLKYICMNIYSFGTSAEIPLHSFTSKVIGRTGILVRWNDA